MLEQEDGKMALVGIYWLKYKVDSMDIFHIGGGTRQTAVNLNKSSRPDVASVFFCLY